MSHAITFDTLAFAKKLEASGIDARQAEGASEALRDVFEENLNTTVFTKQDGKSLESKIEILENKMDTKISTLKTELTMWMVGLLFAQTAIIVSVIKFIH